MATLKNVIMPLVFSFGVVTMLSGCKFFDLSNPFIPTSRLYAVPDATEDDVTFTYKITDNTIDTTFVETTVSINSYPGDGTPGCLINSYSAEYLDEVGQAIPTITLSKVNFGVSAYIPPANGSSPSTVKMSLPIYNQQVRLYGIAQCFDLAGQPQLNPNLIHTIDCSVTLYGQDDNFNQVTIPVSVPIRFAGNITQ